jgi:hypothetical protein
MSKLLKDPLFHFLLLGVGFFGLFTLVSDDSETPGTKVEEIVVTQGRIESLLIQFGKVWQRPPTEEELDGLIADYVREEILYREAVAMGLDRDDTIVRRRMRQKLEFLSEDLAALAEPTEVELQQYLEDNPEMFRQESRFSFRQVYVNVDDRGTSAEAHALGILERLNNENGDASQLGDSMLLEHDFKNQSEREIARVLGKQFLDGLLEAPTGSWEGPIRSGFGLHLIHISERIEGGTPRLEEVRDAVVREWSSAKRKQTNEQFYDMLREGYTVTVMKPRPSNSTVMAEEKE